MGLCKKADALCSRGLCSSRSCKWRGGEGLPGCFSGAVGGSTRATSCAAHIWWRAPAKVVPCTALQLSALSLFVAVPVPGKNLLQQRRREAPIASHRDPFGKRCETTRHGERIWRLLTV